MDYKKILDEIKRKSELRMAALDPKDVMHENYEAVDGKYTTKMLDFLKYANWTRSFFPGALALLYAEYKDEKFLQYLEDLKDVYNQRLQYGIDVRHIHHDAGFTYVLYSIAMHEVSGDEEARQMSLKVADEFVKLFFPKVGLFQGFGGSKGDVITIVDDMMNISLIMWAYEQTKHPFYKTLFTSHVNTMLKTMLREDYSLRHSYLLNGKTGEPVSERNYCGYAPGSQWARGNAWVIYGLTNAISVLNHNKGMDWEEINERDNELGYHIASSYKEDAELVANYVDALNGILNRYLSQLGEDGIPLWDMKELSNEYGVIYDTSAAAIVASALYKLCEVYDVDKLQGLARHAREYADKILETLSTKYLSKPEDECFIDGGQAGYKMIGCVWGDYFYVEALMRKLHGKDAPEFWGKETLPLD